MHELSLVDTVFLLYELYPYMHFISARLSTTSVVVHLLVHHTIHVYTVLYTVLKYVFHNSFSDEYMLS